MPTANKPFRMKAPGFSSAQMASQRHVSAIYELPNAREDAARHNRYLITPQDYLKGELEA